VHVATARCLPYGQTLTYWPLRGLLAGLLGSELEHPEVIKQQLSAAFARGGHTPVDAARLAELVLTTLGVEREGVSERESIFLAWRLLVAVCAQQAPHIVVFEDLHWASDSLLDLVEQLMHPGTQAPLLLIVLSRPELLDRRPLWGGGRRNFTALALDPLTEAQARELVERLTAGLHQGIRERIVERCGGNPFFAIELVRGLAERGIAEPAGRTLALPDTVHAAVLARLDLLSPRERAVMQAAAVAGRSFRPAMLHAVLSDAQPPEIDAALDSLLARDLMVSAEGGAFSFRHVLNRDVAYGTLSRAERIRLHGKIAAWLESAAAERLDEFTELIAYHYREAVLLARRAAVPLAMPIDPARAVHYLERAGDLAGHAGAFAEARAYLQSAIDLAPEADHVRLYEQLGDGVLGGDTAVNAYRKALERWRDEEGGDPRIGARLLRKLLIVHMRYQVAITLRPNTEEIVAWRTEALRLAEAAGDEEESWRIRVADLFWPYWRGNITAEEAEEGRAVALAAAAHFETQGNWVSFSEALDGYASLSEMIGAYRDTLEASKRRLSAPELPAMERGDALNMVVHAYLALGNYEGCIATMQEELAQLRPSGPVGHLGAALAFATWAAFMSGRWSELSDLTPILEDVWEQVQHNPGIARFVAGSYLAALHVALAREDRAAADTLASILHRIVPDTMPNERSLVAAYLEDDLHPLDLNPASMGHTTVTLEVWITAILMFLQERAASAPAGLITRARLWPNGTVRWVVEIAEALGTSDLARLAKAIDEAEAHGLIVHAARMRIVLAQRTSDRTQLSRARPVLERLGDRQFLRRLEEVAKALDERDR
jgi:tetratricopeptide (TPR) repeat protein